jgi:hypothetical protein
MVAIWERDQGAEPVSYLKEMVTHQYSLYGLLGSLALGTLLAFPYGFGAAVIPLLCFVAGEAIAALFVPNSSLFRDRVDRKKRQERREQARAHLIAEIRRRVQDDPSWDLYYGMCERLASLRAMVRSRPKSSVSSSDIERLEDATVDFLGLWLGRLTMHERLEALDEGALEVRLKAVSAQLAEAQAHNRPPLMRAKTDLERILMRRERLMARQTAVEAAMLALADTFNEIYQGVMTRLDSGDIAQQLQEAVERLHIEEDLDLGLDQDLEAEGLRREEINDDRDHAGRAAKALRLRAQEPRG